MDSVALYSLLNQNNAISDVWKYVLNMLRQKYRLSDDVLKLLCLYFSLIDDGNVCISLDKEQLKQKWQIKLNGLNIQDDVTDYNTIIIQGIDAINKYASDNDTPLIWEYSNQSYEIANCMFVVYKNWMYTEKFFDAKQIIKEAVHSLFLGQTEQNSTELKEKIQNVINKYTKKDNSRFSLAPEQAEAIVRATQGQNLIITGGPGTGKTTIICYLLLDLLSADKNHTIYMVAPSGKAAKRMKESISASLTAIKQDATIQQQTECDKIDCVTPTTIHKLLGMESLDGYTTKILPPNSIVIIDEASMIDIVLFAKLLNMIKQTDNARVFILGDKDQIPSVQPGAVFYDLTQHKNNCLIELTQTHRFTKGSEIYDLKQNIQRGDASAISVEWQPISENWYETLATDQIKLESDKQNYPVKYLTISSNDDMQTVAHGWYNVFYGNDEYKQIYTNIDFTSSDIVNTLDKIWSYLTKAKILCAERQGPRGAEKINNIICEHIKRSNVFQVTDNDNFFIGEQIIITENQKMYDLSNGDIGLIVCINDKKYIMIKRNNSIHKISDTDTDWNTEIVLHKGNFVFYPLYLLPSNAIEPAYAITIHKSQGSEYNNILVCLPESDNSPLLNRNILYTAITRTKQSTYIISDKNNMTRAIMTVPERDTQLLL